MMQKLAKAQWQLMKYGIFMGVVGGVASFVGPLDSGLHNALLGVAAGGMLLGCKPENALKELFRASNELADKLFDD